MRFKQKLNNSRLKQKLKQSYQIKSCGTGYAFPSGTLEITQVFGGVCVAQSLFPMLCSVNYFLSVYLFLYYQWRRQFIFDL